MKPIVSLRKALSDPALLGGALPGESWRAWRVLIIAAVGERLHARERRLFKEVTGRETEPGTPVEELWAIVGRRGGKTRAAAALAVYIACLCDHSAALASGERGALPILAASTTQATRAFNHVSGILEHSPKLADEIESKTADVIRLKAGIDIEIRPANFRTIRGITAVAVIADEVAYWSVEGSSNPDSEILDAARPSLLTTGGMLFVISSPYARRGELYTTYSRHFGHAGDQLILVAKGASRTFNPTLPQAFIDRAYERDAAVAGAEYGAEFRTDVESFVSREAVNACVAAGVFERAPIVGFHYFGFVDPSGGSADSMTMAIAHAEDDRAILDAVREVKPPFSPESVVGEFAVLLKSYQVSTVRGDRYAGEWPREQFQKMGIRYEPAESPKSDIYRDFLPLINSGRADLLDDRRMIDQLCALERRTARGGRDSIDHPPSGHDDRINAAAGALVLASGVQRSHAPITYGSLTGALDNAPIAYGARYGRNADTFERLHRQMLRG